jgi:hypothetical protein
VAADFVVILILSVLGLMAHGARNQPWMEWTLRVIYGIACVAELYSASTSGISTAEAPAAWTQIVSAVMGVATGALLFRPVRRLISLVLSAIEFVVDGQLFVCLRRKVSPREAFAAQRIFMPDSIPHMNAMWIYITTLGMLLSNINPESFKVPAIGIPFPVTIDSLLWYNLLGLVVLAFCGVGVFVARKPNEAMQRLGLVKPEGWHYGLAFFGVVITGVYDFLWSTYTNMPQSGIGEKLGQYNAGTFTAGGGAAPSALLALATGLCAGVGEETLMRGALTPVFGALGAGFLHGALHGQFNHMPLVMIQIAGWSTMMGVLRRYSNTTTTIMIHSGYNLIFTFLFAFNP